MEKLFNLHIEKLIEAKGNFQTQCLVSFSL
jgi:hypothetical protein